MGAGQLDHVCVRAMTRQSGKSSFDVCTVMWEHIMYVQGLSHSTLRPHCMVYCGLRCWRRDSNYVASDGICLLAA